MKRWSTWRSTFTGACSHQFSVEVQAPRSMPLRGGLVLMSRPLDYLACSSQWSGETIRPL
ncbi:hypothetical protein BS17DRAFT_529524 [Gyrodon lividus]|nr:hypothetical protein BS17DRAFT_529524 [Gyrodon lividus]